MQLFAFDKGRRVISARLAEKKQNYSCMECGGIVRLRGGVQRQNHFYHPQISDNCSQNGKSMAHLQVQCFLQKILPGSELERPFPEVRRIADVVWEAEKIIFEVQCSPISAEEVQNRNRDYGSQGYQVVWILHDHRFNQANLAPAERSLAGSPHYYTNINAEGEGILYDQFRIGAKKLPPLPIDPSSLFHHFEIACDSSFVQNRLKNWLLFFEGDLVALFSRGEEEEYFRQMRQLEQEANRSLFWGLWKTCVAEPYRKLFQLVLENCCG